MAFFCVFARSGLCGGVHAWVDKRWPVLPGWFSDRCVCLLCFLLLREMCVTLARRRLWSLSIRHHEIDSINMTQQQEQSKHDGVHQATEGLSAMQVLMKGLLELQ